MSGDGPFGPSSAPGKRMGEAGDEKLDPSPLALGTCVMPPAAATCGSLATSASVCTGAQAIDSSSSRCAISALVYLPNSASMMVTSSAATPVAKYLFVLGIVAVLALLAKNMVRSNIGREWMAIRDMDIAAEIIGIKMLSTKLKAFAVSSFYCGIAGALWAFCYTGSVEPLAFDINRSFQVLFMIIIGGLGSILGSFLGAAFIVLLPIFLNNVPTMLGLNISVALISHLEFMIFGALIIFFLIVEPHGFARLWQITKEKLRLWPFPY